jgi:Ca-activated chloride channel homolog
MRATMARTVRAGGWGLVLVGMVGVLGAGRVAASGQPEWAMQGHWCGTILIPWVRGESVEVWEPRERPPVGWSAVKLESVETSARIRGEVASTEMKLTVRNPGRGQREAQLLIPVPDGVTVSSMVLEGLGEDGIARMLPRDEARRIYNDIVRRAKDPALAEFAGHNLIKTSVFPVPPGGMQTVAVTWEQVLPGDDGRVDYILPRSESLQSHGVSWSMSLDIRSETRIATVYSPSHELAIERISDGHIVARVTDKSAREDAGSLRVSFLADRPDGAVPATLMAYPDPTVGDGEGGYFLLLAAAPPVDRAGPVKREVIVVIDRSGSMAGVKMAQALEAARQVIESLEEGEAFNIIDFASSVERFSDRPVIKDEETIAQARAYLRTIRASGGTALHGALIESLRQPTHEGMLSMVLYLTDGLPTVGPRGEGTILEAAKAANAHGRRVFTFGVGYDVNAPLLSGIADASRGATTFVLPEEDVEVKVAQVFRRLSGPVLAGPELAALDAEGRVSTRLIRDVQPGVLPDLFEGDRLIVLGTYTKDGPLAVRLSGGYLGEERTFEFSFDTSEATVANAHVPRLWATRKIGQMIAEVRRMGADGHRPSDDPRYKELVDEIVHLSTKWGVLTEYTAFLALEPDEVGPAAWRLEPGRMHRFADDALRERAMAQRIDREGVSQDMNIGQWAATSRLNTLNTQRTADMGTVRYTSIRQVADQTLYNRAGRWIDARLLETADREPDITIDFGTNDYVQLLDRLARANHQGLLANAGDIYLLLDDQRVLVRSPE